MTTINLQEYLERINTLIEEGQLTEAIGHCRNILETYPRHIDTYRLLAKALLEQHAYDDAADLFQRILSADPNDFISHVGLSVVRSETDQMDQSLWHLERAFELEPYNAAIQDELRRHYAQFSEMSIDRIPLTSGALARLYIKGELYHQAVQELNQVLKSERDRIDLEVLLAEALWRNDQRIDAEEICLDVLQRLPNCIVVNAILSEIWLQTGRIGESQKYLQRLQQLTNLDKAHLDLDTAVGRAFFTDGAPPLPEKITLEFKGDYETVAGQTAVAAKGPSADWMSDVSFDSEISEKFEYNENEPGILADTPSGMHNYDWMADVNEGMDAEEEQIPKPETEWFMDSAGSNLNAEEEFNRLFEEDVTDAPEAEEAVSALDWFQDDVTLAAEDDLASEGEAAPGWLSDLIGETDRLALEDEPDGAAEPVAVTSDWFADVDNDDDAPTFESEFGEASADWLSDLDDDEDEALAEAVAVEPLFADDDDDEAEPDFSEVVEGKTPIWLHDAVAESSLEMDEAFAEADSTAEDDTAVEDEIPDWLADHAPEDVGAEAAESADLADWIADVDEIDDEVALDATAARMGELTSWLKDQDEDELEERPLAEDEDLNDWLAESTAEPAAAPSGMMAAAAAFFLDDDDDDVPISTTDELREAEAFDDDWLSVLSDDEPEEEELAAVDETAVALDDNDLSDDSFDILTPATDGLGSDWLAAPENDWMVGLGEVEETISESESTPFESQEAVANTQEDIPDWLLGDETDESKLEGVVTGDKEENEEKEAEFNFEADDDWMSKLGDESEVEEDDAAETAVPDWLSAESDVAETTTPSKPTLEAADVDIFDMLSDEDDSASWLTDMALDDPEPAAEADSDAFAPEAEVVKGGLTAWLADAPEGQGLIEPEDEFGELDFDLGDEAAESGLTSWLTKMADDEVPLAAEAEGEAAEFDEGAAEGGLTSWLSNMADDAESATSEAELEPDLAAADFTEDGLTDWLTEDAEPALANLPQETAEDSWDLLEEADDEDEGMLDWLADEPQPILAEATAESSELSLTEDAEDEEAEWDLGEGALSDWMTAEPDAELEDDDLLEELTAVAAVLSSEPENNLYDDIPDIPSEELFATDEGNLPDWLSDGTSDVTDIVAGAADLPDWLSDIESSATDLPAALDSEHLLDSDAAGLLDFDDDDLFPAMAEEEEETTLASLPEAEALGGLTSDGLTELLAETDEASSALGDLDLDVDVSWLDDLTLDDEEAEALTAEEMPEDDTDLDWLSGAVTAPSGLDMEEEALDTAVADEVSLEPAPVDIGIDGLAEEDDAMSWLEDLASQQETPVDDMPTVARDVLADDLAELDVVTAEAKLETDEAIEAADLIEAEEDSDSWLDVLLTEEDALIAEAVRQEEEERAAEIAAAAALDEPPEDVEDAMVWLEGLAAKQGAALEELPSQQAEFNSDFGELDGDLEDIDSWIQGLQSEKEESLAEEDRELAEALDFLEDQVLAEGITPVAAKVTVSVSADELAEALDWLETADSDLAERAVDATQLADFEELDFTAVADAVEDEAELDFLAFDSDVADSDLDFLTALDEGADSEEAAEFDDDLDLLDMPDDPEAAMAWLEQMTEGADDIAFDMEPPPITPSEDAAFAVDYGAETETAVVEEADEAELELAADVLVEDEDDDVDLFDMPDDPDEAMAWLEEMASDEAGDIEFDMEPPPITPSEDAAFAVDYGTETETAVAKDDEAAAEAELELEVVALAADDAEDDEDFDLLSMLEGDGDIEFDMEPPPITPSEDAAFAVDYGDAADSEAEAEIELGTAVVEESLAKTDDLADFDVFDMPEDPDEAMNWLAAMASGDDDIEFDMEPPPITPSEDAAFAVDYGDSSETAVADDDDIAEELASSITSPLELKAEETLAAAGVERIIENEDDDLFDLDDDEDAMAWLTAMTDGDGDIEFDMEPPPISPSEDAAFADIDYGGRSETVADDVLADVPDDPDEAMAWLEKMADQQTSELGDTLGDLPLMADTPLPAWLQGEEEEPGIPNIAEISGAESGKGDLDITENLGVEIDGDLSDSLPDWFSMDEPPQEQTGWLRSLEKIDVGSWLEAEEEVTGKEVDADVSLPDTGEIRRKFGTGPLPSLGFDEPDLPSESPEVSPTSASSAYQVDDSQISLARSAIENSRFEEAAGQYQKMIASGSGTMTLINELEGVAQNYPNQPAFRRLLGDAYMRNGQLQKALNTYRDALDHL